MCFFSALNDSVTMFKDFDFSFSSHRRFADFIEGSPHLMSNEVSVHAQEYGLGSSLFEDELFSTDEEDEEETWETEEVEKPNASSPRRN